jgi:hypothetical protein
LKHTAHQVVKAVLGLKPASLSAASTLGPVIDTLGFREALIHALYGTAAAGAESDITVLHGDESDGSDMAAITGAAFTQVTAANDDQGLVGRINLELETMKRYIQIKNAGDGANAALVAVSVLLIGARKMPVTQEATTVFNIT